MPLSAIAPIASRRFTTATRRVLPFVHPSSSRAPRIACATPSTAAALRNLSSTPAAMFSQTPYQGASQPSTFSRQASLARLPVPPLEQTLSTYLKTLEPILMQREEKNQLPPGVTASDEMAKRRKWAEEALQPGSVVRKLQERLIDLDRASPNNWLDDNFWIKKAYHEWRVPLLINSNWWLTLRADPNSPAGQLEASSTAEVGGELVPPEDPAKAMGEQTWEHIEWGIRRATWMTHRFLDFKRRLDREEIMPDASKAGAFCMHQYTQVFGVTRIPALPADYNTAPAHPNKAKHITVIARNNVYELQVLGDDGMQVPFEAIERAFYAIVDDAKRGDGEGVPVLTSDHRDTWARERQHLLSISEANRASLTSIEDSLFAISLESSVLPVPKDQPPVAHPAAPLSVQAQSRSTSGAGRGGHNRWYDKGITLAMEPNGRTAVCGEHSPCDALIPSIIAEYALASPAPVPGAQYPELPHVAVSGSAEWKKLEWRLDERARQAIRNSSAAARKVAAASDQHILWYNEYGADWMKKVARQAPDAYIQMVLQLANAKLRGGVQTPTYETASTRAFLHGRTDVIRSFSSEAYAFVRAVRENRPSAELYRLMVAATTAHSAQTRASSQGRGIDRHLLGLRVLYDAQQDGSLDDVCSSQGGGRLLFGDDLMAESQTWRLSTSGLSEGKVLAGTGFGAGYADGIGINYLAGGSLLKFGIEGKSGEYGGGELGRFPATAMANAIVEALAFTRELCEKEAPAAAAAAAAADSGKGRL